MLRTSRRTGLNRLKSRSLTARSMIGAAVTETLESRRLMTVSLDNGLATTNVDYFQVTVDKGGNTRDTKFGATDTVYDYFGYLDTGATTYAVGTYGSDPVIGSDGVARSSGTIPIAAGGSVAFTVESSIRSGSKAYVNQYTFTSTGYDLTQAKFFEYLDADIQAVSDDILTVKGTIAGTGSNNLVLTTIDPATDIRQAQSNGVAGDNTTLTGFGADRFSTLRSAISGGAYDAAPGGTNNLPATTVTGIGPAFGPGDITTALEYGFSNATAAMRANVDGRCSLTASIPGPRPPAA